MGFGPLDFIGNAVSGIGGGLHDMLSGAWGAIKPAVPTLAALTAAYYGMPELGAMGEGGSAAGSLTGGAFDVGGFEGLTAADVGLNNVGGGLSGLMSMLGGGGGGVLGDWSGWQLDPGALMSMFGSGTPGRSLGIAPWMRTGMGLMGMGQAARMMRGAQLPNPGDIQGLPGYQAGIDAVMRGQRAANNAPSGAELAALQKYGGDAYNQAVGQRLASSQAQMMPLLMMMGSGGLLEKGLSGFGF